jgi:LysR family glycine cleavage system transcriptional activator
LPPLNTLRFFEAAARHGSFARAAAELCITAGAVSRQVKVLEESLGVALFHRHPQRLEITRTGEMLLRTVQDAINSIEQETRRIETDKNVVRIGLSPNFAVRWMSSRLHELKAEFPSLRLVIDASPELSDLSAGEVDFVIRFGNGYWEVSFSGGQGRRNCYRSSTSRPASSRLVPDFDAKV